jgi:hypothetical protein
MIIVGCDYHPGIKVFSYRMVDTSSNRSYSSKSEASHYAAASKISRMSHAQNRRPSCNPSIARVLLDSDVSRHGSWSPPRREAPLVHGRVGLKHALTWFIKLCCLRYCCVQVFKLPFVGTPRAPSGLRAHLTDRIQGTRGPREPDP